MEPMRSEPPPRVRPTSHHSRNKDRLRLGHDISPPIPGGLHHARIDRIPSLPKTIFQSDYSKMASNGALRADVRRGSSLRMRGKDTNKVNLIVAANIVF
jgi:hypothetical protein